MLIRQDGLCQTMAFLEAKAATGKSFFGRSVRDFAGALGSDSAAVRTAAAPEYQRLSREALRKALWFKRYAESVLKVTPDDDQGDL